MQAKPRPPNPRRVIDVLVPAGVRMMAAAKAARIHRFITSLPQGYDTVLTDGGAGISKGRRQLPAIARRLATIRNAGCILVPEEGRAAEQRRREELLARGGRYAAQFE